MASFLDPSDKWLEDLGTGVFSNDDRCDATETGDASLFDLDMGYDIAEPSDTSSGSNTSPSGPIDSNLYVFIDERVTDPALDEKSVTLQLADDICREEIRDMICKHAGYEHMHLADEEQLVPIMNRDGVIIGCVVFYMDMLRVGHHEDGHIVSLGGILPCDIAEIYKLNERDIAIQLFVVWDSLTHPQYVSDALCVITACAKTMNKHSIMIKCHDDNTMAMMKAHGFLECFMYPYLFYPINTPPVGDASAGVRIRLVDHEDRTVIFRMVKQTTNWEENALTLAELEEVFVFVSADDQVIGFLEIRDMDCTADENRIVTSFQLDKKPRTPDGFINVHIEHFVITPFLHGRGFGKAAFNALLECLAPIDKLLLSLIYYEFGRAKDFWSSVGFVNVPHPTLRREEFYMERRFDTHGVRVCVPTKAQRDALLAIINETCKCIEDDFTISESDNLLVFVTGEDTIVGFADMDCATLQARDTNEVVRFQVREDLRNSDGYIHMYIGLFIILTKWRGKGYGRLAFQKMMQLTRDIPFTCFEIESVASSRPFWKKMGFEHMRKRKTTDAANMEIRLHRGLHVPV